MFVQNLAPGAADRLGTSAAALRARAPAADRLQRLRATASSGPVRGEEGLRPAGAERGRAAVDHRHGRRAGKVGISVADIAAGMYAYSGILTALLARGHDRARRRRSTCRCSTRSASGWARRRTTRPTAARRRRAAAPHHASIAPYGPFATGDGGQVYLGDPERARVDAVLRRRPRAAGARATIRASARTRCACAIAQALHDVIESAFAGA